MIVTTVYQTLENRNNRNDVEKNGPFSCNWENTWLGDGYYFWDTFIENAHWWGNEIRKYENGYFICKAICDFNHDECFDLVGNTSHLIILYETYKLLKDEGLVDNTTTVKRLVRFLKDDIKKFNYTAIRALGVRSKNFNSIFSFTLNFEDNKPQYLDFKPAIQICFFSKDSLNLRNYQLIFPHEMLEDYLV